MKVSDFLFVGDEKLAKHAAEFEVIRLCQAMVVTSNNVPSAKYATLKAMSEFKDAEEAALWLAQETEDYYDVLEGVKMYAIGDSYFGGSQLGQHQTWVNLLGYKYGMTFHNYGIGGNTVATARGQSSNQPPMHTRYDQMPTDGDIYIIEGGRNDRHYSVPFGQNDGKTVTSFKGATLTNSADAEQFIEVIEEPETTVSIETEAPVATEPTTEPAPEKGCGGFSTYAIITVIVCGACLAVRRRK